MTAVGTATGSPDAGTAQLPQLMERAVAGMPPVLATEVTRWYPFCDASIRATVDDLRDARTLATMLGRPLSTARLDALATSCFDPVDAYLLRGGKRLRPFLVCLTIDALGGDPERFAPLVAAAELIHSSSLILDDAADDSDLRRGGPTATRLVGVRVAGIAASVWLHAAFELLWRQGAAIDPDVADQLGQELAWEHWVTGLGTTIDTTWPWLDDLDHLPAEYLQSVVHRSTSYSFRMPFRIGGLLGGASPEQYRQLVDLGEESGLAFQIIDDILNVRPGDGNWGKRLAEDLTAGKVNLQVLLALQRSQGSAREHLVTVLRSRTEDEDALRRAVDTMADCGALDAAREVAVGHVDRCRQLVAGMGFLPDRHRAVLSAFIDYMLTRGH